MLTSFNIIKRQTIINKSDYQIEGKGLSSRNFQPEYNLTEHRISKCRNTRKRLFTSEDIGISDISLSDEENYKDETDLSYMINEEDNDKCCKKGCLLY
jgi:hypothetical protein